MGIDNPKTMKMVGTINGKEIVVMVDPGATHNFISPRAVEELKLQVHGTKEFAVSLGTGDAIRGWGECREVKLMIQGFEIMDSFYPMELGNSDIILGIQWLETLGSVGTNWKTQTMKFWQGDSEVVLQGDPSLGR